MSAALRTVTSTSPFCWITNPEQTRMTRYRYRQHCVIFQVTVRGPCGMGYADGGYVERYRESWLGWFDFLSIWMDGSPKHTPMDLTVIPCNMKNRHEAHNTNRRILLMQRLDPERAERFVLVPSLFIKVVCQLWVYASSPSSGPFWSVDGIGLWVLHRTILTNFNNSFWLGEKPRNAKYGLENLLDRSYEYEIEQGNKMDVKG